ncbi:MAG TPA: hypothetical protein PLZ51_18455, partial [Aggregatilineales bacterium]|nr:hypothetical protein [Aggregatilineales bacterium]
MNEFDDFSDIEEIMPKSLPKPSDETVLSPDTAAQLPHRRRLEDLTLAELLGQFLRAPFKTWRGLSDIAGQSSVNANPSESPTLDDIVDIDMETTTRMSIETPTDHTPEGEITPEQRLSFREARRQFLKLGLYVMAFALAFWGSIILVSAEIRYESGQLDKGAPFLLAGFLLWLFAEFSDGKFTPLAGFRNSPITISVSDDTLPNPERLEDTAMLMPFTNTWAIHPVRIFAGIGAVFFSVVAWISNPQNQFSGVGFWGWLAAVACAVVLFAPKSWSPPQLYKNMT